MNLICVDDEVLVLELTVSLCREILPEDAEVNGFFRVSDALDYVASNHVDIALLDIDMPVMNGLVLAARIKELQPDFEEILETTAGCTVTSHCGPYTLGVLFIRKA